LGDQRRQTPFAEVGDPIMTRSVLTRTAVFLLVTAMLVAAYAIVESDAVVRFTTVSAPAGFIH
jgi:hypothetical protein